MDYQQTFLNLPKLTIRENAGHLVTTPEQCAQRFEHTAELAQEVFSVLTLDTKNREIDRHTITIGTLNSSLVHPRDIFRVAITDNAAAIILSHNHPSGDSQESLCWECYEQARAIGAFLSTAYPINWNLIAKGAA